MYSSGSSTEKRLWLYCSSSLAFGEGAWQLYRFLDGRPMKVIRIKLLFRQLESSKVFHILDLGCPEVYLFFNLEIYCPRELRLISFVF